jgi:hypothetical protein
MKYIKLIFGTAFARVKAGLLKVNKTCNNNLA